METNDKLDKVVSLLKSQNIFDTNMTLQQLSEQISDVKLEGGNTVAWDRYVYHTHITDEGAPVQERTAELVSSTKTLNLNARVSDIIKLAQDHQLDQLGGHIYTQDRFTFIVA